MARLGKLSGVNVAVLYDQLYMIRIHSGSQMRHAPLLITPGPLSIN